MTLDAWRSAAGGAWRLLLLYPSGLTLLVLVGLVWLVSRRSSGISLPSERLAWLAWSGPLVMLAFLPAPKANEIRAPLDLFVAVLLLEVALWLALAVALRGSKMAQEWAANTVAATLTAAPLLILGLTLWAKSTGLTLAALTAREASPLFWLGLGCWVLGLLPALLLGPWHAPIDGPWKLTLTTRRIGYVALLALPLWRRIPLPEQPQTLWERLVVDGRVVFGLLGFGIGLGFWVLHHTTRRGNPVWWGRGVWAIGCLVLLVWLVLVVQAPR